MFSPFENLLFVNKSPRTSLKETLRYLVKTVLSIVLENVSTRWADHAHAHNPSNTKLVYTAADLKNLSQQRQNLL